MTSAHNAMPDSLGFLDGVLGDQSMVHLLWQSDVNGALTVKLQHPPRPKCTHSFFTLSSINTVLNYKLLIG